MERQDQDAQKKDDAKHRPGRTGNDDDTSGTDTPYRGTGAGGRGSQNLDRPQPGGTMGQTWSGSAGANKGAGTQNIGNRDNSAPGGKQMTSDTPNVPSSSTYKSANSPKGADAGAAGTNPNKNRATDANAGDDTTEDDAGDEEA
ncbi:MAG: hypothetical protein ABSF83_12940 [Nitrososphaerales archaeon]|jgi:hypothetical protein